MEFDEWEPAYERVLADFGYSRTADERARDALAEICRPFDLSRLDAGGRTVAVVGAAPALADDVDRLAAAEVDLVFAASSAAAVLREAGLDVDCVVTDLDGTPAVSRALAREGTPVAVHAHGDNVSAIRDRVPAFDPAHVLGTTQAAPRSPVRNFGGFTDGDRAAFLADHLGAARLAFFGWEFDDPDVSPTKRRKLRWAARLLRWLERRRGERFDVLDGRRGSLDLPWVSE